MEDQIHEDTMTFSEFKAWFEGFTESMDGPPSQKQWERIQARVSEIAAPVATPLPNPFMVGVRVPGIGYNTCLDARGPNDGVGRVAFTGAQPAPAVGAWATMKVGGAADPFPGSHAAMNALGKADAASLAA